MKTSLVFAIFVAMFGIVYFVHRMEKAALTSSFTPEELIGYKATKKTLWQRIRGKKKAVVEEAKEEEE